MQAGPAVDEFRLRAVRVQPGHQSEHAHDEKNRRGKRAQETQARPETYDEIRCRDGPGDEERGFVDIVDRTTIQGETTFGHGDGMANDGEDEEAVVDAVAVTEALAPKEDGIKHADAVENHGQQKEMSIGVRAGKPNHEFRIRQGIVFE